MRSVAHVAACAASAFVVVGSHLPLAHLALAQLLYMPVPAFQAVAFHLFPSTPLGRRIMPSPPEPHELVPGREERERLSQFVGKQGRVTTDLLPWGQVEISQEKIEAVSRAGPIASGTVIEVVGAEGRAVVVRTIETKPELRAFPEPSEDGQITSSPQEKRDESPIPSAKTFEEFKFDDYEKPSGA